MSYETIKYHVKDNIAIVTINRPEALNAVNSRMLNELLSVAGEIAKEDSIRVVILTGEGKAFVAGADISEMKDFGVTEGYEFSDLGHRAFLAFEELDKPVIAAVNGFALGGGTELALACDFILASDKAKFGQPEVNLGVIPGFGGTRRLARAVGINKARELIYSGEIIGAEEARRIGLVSEVYGGSELMDKAFEKAGLIASKGPCSVASAKSVINKGADLPLESALELEKQAFSAIFGTEDQTEGMGAFIEKRKPVFKGK